MVSVMLYPCIFWVSLLMDLFVFCVMEVFSVGGGALLD